MAQQTKQDKRAVAIDPVLPANGINYTKQEEKTEES